jgi:hypothetical protein
MWPTECCPSQTYSQYKGWDFCLRFIHLTTMRPTKGENTDIRCYIVRLLGAISLKLQESNLHLYATRFSIMRSLVKRLGMGLPNNLLPEFPAITGSLIDRSIDLLFTFFKICNRSLHRCTNDCWVCVEGCRRPSFNLYFIIATIMIIIIKAI